MYTTNVPDGTGSIMTDDIRCTGSEFRLIDCVTVPSSRSCSHIEDAGVQCAQGINRKYLFDKILCQKIPENNLIGPIYNYSILPNIII